MRKSKAVLLILAFAVAFFLYTELLTGVSSQTSSNASVSAPAIEWQEKYGNMDVESVSNVIQTSDGGYVFMDLGWHYQGTFIPSTVYKVDSSGSLQWNKTVEDLRVSTILQTNDEGYEIAGQWLEYTPTIIKMDSQGSIQWVQNYSSVPDLDIASTSIRTSDGGFAYWTDGNITKTDSNNSTQWVKPLTYTGVDGTVPLKLTSLIETSDGALAALGVGTNLRDNSRMGTICLIKTEAFLPLPSQTPLPTPIPTPLPPLTVEATVIVALIVVVVALAGLLVFLKKRKP
jgi:hypothetical protein